MNLIKLVLKSILILVVIALNVMSSQFQKDYKQENSYIQYFNRNLHHNHFQQKEPKVIYRSSIRKIQNKTIIDDKFVTEVYEKLKFTEQKLEYSTTTDVYQYNDTLTKQVDTYKKISRQWKGLNFKNLSFEESVGNMLSILQTKLNCIGDIYQPKHVDIIDGSNDEKYADPYYANICMDYEQKQYYHFTLNYSGLSQYAKQPGNSLIRQSVPWGEDYSKYLQKNEDLKDLLLALEVARRKVIDNDIKLKDEYADLPIYCASAMIIDLINNRKIDEREFWIKNGNYHMYSDTKEIRESSIKNIIRQYLTVYKINNFNHLQSKLFE